MSNYFIINRYFLSFDKNTKKDDKKTIVCKEPKGLFNLFQKNDLSEKHR